MILAKLQQVYGADQVIIDQAARTAVFVNTCQNRRVCRAIQNPIDGRKRLKVFASADVSKFELNAQFLQQAFVLPGARSREIVQTDDFERTAEE